MAKKKQMVLWTIVIIGAAAVLFAGKKFLEKPAQAPSIASGNGRIEATEVDIATKLPGRLEQILAREGDMVKAGQVLARFDTKELEARLQQANAQVEQAKQNKAYSKALVEQRKSELALARKNLERSQSLYVDKNISLVQLQQNETAVESMRAVLSATEAQVVSADAAISAAMAQLETIQVNIDDSILKSPINGRVLYRLAEPGEVFGGGGKILTLLEVEDVYMTVFLPTMYAGRVNIGNESRIILDALPDIAIPAKVTFISPQAQFTPKEIETRTEREKLMFRIKVTVDPELLEAHLEKVKTGLPGVAYIKLDESAPWPAELNQLPKMNTSAEKAGQS